MNRTLRLCTLSLLIQTISSGLAFSQLLLTHGPVVGGVTDSVANVFLRSVKPATVSLRYGTDPTLLTYQDSGSARTSPSSDFTSTLRLGGLTAQTTYYLNPLVNGVPQLTAPFPSFTTFPARRNSSSFNFVVLTDFESLKNLRQPVQTFASAAATNPAFVFIGGDFDHRNPPDRANKRRMFRELYDPNSPFMGDFVNLILRKVPIVHQWDDHDAGLNNIDKTYVDWGLDQQVFEEYVPTYKLPSVQPGIWQQFSYAQVDFFVLDCRSQRDPENDPDDANKSMLDGNALGADGQLEWLEQGLLKSTARWKIIFTSVITNPTAKFPEGWAGYQTEWNALKTYIQTNNISGIIFISGDLHLAAIDNGSASGFPEMCVPEPNALQTSGHCATGKRGRWSEGYYDDTCSGFGLITVSDAPDQVTLQTADEFGTIHLSYTVSGNAP